MGRNTPQTPLRKETIRSVCAKIAQENMSEDLGKTMQFLEDMRARDNELSVKFKIDSEGKITSMLWCTGMNKEDYKRFADAITFDTTYRTTLQAPFWFVCRSKQSFSVCYFRGVMLKIETTEDFEWAFTKFVEIMGGKAPQTMLTGKKYKLFFI